jgi:hypothetical protein
VLALGVPLGLLAWTLFALASYRAQLGLCVAVPVVALAVWRLVVASTPPPEPPDPIPGDVEPTWGGFANLSTLEHRLSWGSVDRERYETRLRPQLARLAEERLRQRHGVDPARQPDLARQIVGEPLWQLMTGPPVSGDPPTPRLIGDLLTYIERI